ncbi:hypothetical protein SCYAM73S_04907 [Streptomyces cyaneofuscatus]
MPRLRTSGEHRAHPGPVGGERTVVRGGVDAAHGLQVAGRVPRHPGRLGRAEEGVESPPGVVRAEQGGRGDEGRVGVGGGAGAQGEQAVDVRGQTGRGALLPRRPGTGQQGAGPVRITREGRLLGRRREPGRAQGRAGGERGGAAEGGGAFAVRVRGGRGPPPAGRRARCPGRERRRRAGRGRRAEGRRGHRRARRECPAGRGGRRSAPGGRALRRSAPARPARLGGRVQAPTRLPGHRSPPAGRPAAHGWRGDGRAGRRAGPRGRTAGG